MSKEDCDVLVNILLLGDVGVGKTSLLTRYVTGEMPSSSTTKATVDLDFKVKKATIEGQVVRTHVWDTAGQERFNSILTKFYRSTNGIILVYDVTNLQSYQNIDRWLEVIEKNCHENIPIFLVGNKCDLQGDHAIPTKYGKQLADDCSLAGFIECSALKNTNIETPFITTIQEILKTKPAGLLDSDSDLRKGRRNKLNPGDDQPCCCA